MKLIKTRKIILLSSIAVLALVYVMQLLFTGRSAVKSYEIEKEITAIEIASPSGKNRIAREDGKWFLSDARYPVSENRASEFVNAVKEIKVLGKASSSSDMDRYGLSEGSLIQVKAYCGDELVRSISVGKNSSTGNQCYIMFDGKSDILLAQGALATTFSSSADDIRSKSVYKISDTDVTGASVVFDSTNYAVVKNVSGEGELTVSTWSLAGSDEKIDSSKVSAWIKSVSNLLVDSWKEDSFVPDESQLKCTVVLKTSDREIIVKIYSAKDEEQMLASCSETRWAFMIPKYAGERFFKDLSDLK